MVPSPLKVNPADVRAERRRTGIREIESELETPRQLHDGSEIQDVGVVVRKRPAVLKPVVEIEAVAIICSCVARIGVRAKNLKPMRETLVGPQQQALVGRAAFPFLYVDRPKRADRLGIVFSLRRGTYGNGWTVNAVEVVEVDRPAQGQMHEMPVGKIGAQNEVSGDLSLNTHAGVQRRRSLIVGRKYPSS